MIIKRLYSFWCLFWFVFIYLLLYPFFLLFIYIKPLTHLTSDLYRIWAGILFPLCGVSLKSKFNFKPNKKQAYIYCPNHGSLLDIPVAASKTPGFSAFVGKKSLTKVPLFGYMFKKLHIPVDRESRISKYKTLIKASEEIDKGRSIIIFPEGRVEHKIQPGLLPFKDGPFRIAIEKQIPVVPVTIPYNWIILPDDNSFMLHRHKSEIIFHEPISTIGMKVEQVDELKNMTYAVIANELLKIFPDANIDKTVEKETNIPYANR